jgi:cyclopropane-fatty-acyl-phospholipid synthase
MTMESTRSSSSAPGWGLPRFLTTGAERAIRDLVGRAGIEVGGSRPWDVKVHDNRFYARVLKDGSLGVGESYMDGWWDCEAVDELVARLVTIQAKEAIQDWRTFLYAAAAKALNLQAPGRAFEVGEKHYDIGNDLYKAMLGESLAYTCAYWKDATTLDAAQRAKFDLVCRKIGLKPGMKVLELGCGWGTFARHAAQHYGAEVTGYTVSKEQVALGRELNRGLPVELRLDDYRRARGQYDAVVSIGIMEHVGAKNYRAYMETADRCLRPGGIAFVHTIGGNRSKDLIDSWFHKYIFPNAVLPSLGQLSRAMEGIFVPEDVHNIGPHYDRTLMEWHANFERAWPTLKARYGERFYRMWRYYLLTCAGSFRARYLQLFQIVMTRPATPQPDCRIS